MENKKNFKLLRKLEMKIPFDRVRINIVCSLCYLKYVDKNKFDMIYEKIFAYKNFKEYLDKEIISLVSSDKVLNTFLENLLLIKKEEYIIVLDIISKCEGKELIELFEEITIDPREISENHVFNILTKIAKIYAKNNTKIYDMNALSVGELIINLDREIKNSSFYINQSNEKYSNLFKMYLTMNGLNNININNQIAIYDNSIGENKYDLVVSIPPFKMLIGDREKLEDLEIFLEYGLPPKSDSGYAYILKALNSLDNDGTAVFLVPNGVLFTKGNSTTKIRKNLVEKNKIEAIISMPAPLFSVSSVSTSIIILKKNKIDDKILFIDATKDTKKIKKHFSILNIPTEENIIQIIDLLKKKNEIGEFKLDSHESNFAYLVSKKDIEENDYDLFIDRYTYIFDQKLLNLKTIKFSEIANIYQASRIKNSDLELLSQKEKTKYSYISPKNLNDDFTITLGENFLKNIPEKEKKYIVKDQSIIISKFTTPILKSAILTVPKGEEILAIGNLYVAEIIDEKFSPYYIQSYLSSNYSKDFLKKIILGKVASLFSISQLNELEIPVLTEEKREKISQKYREKVTEFENLQKKLIEIKEDIEKNIFEIEE